MLALDEPRTTLSLLLGSRIFACRSPRSGVNDSKTVAQHCATQRAYVPDGLF